MKSSYPAAIFLAISSLIYAETKLVRTKSGYVLGREAASRDRRTYYTWKGIPYAEPPVGNLRFEPPVAAKPWIGTLNAFRNPPSCSQIDLYFEAYQGQEDCLYLSVHIPKIPVHKIGLLPVLFAIHGGYFAAGEGRDTSPAYIMDEDVVLVTPNYRLGPLGFLNTGDHVVRGNMGLKDLRLALKWTYENIANFGGDPDRITVQGESAGAAASHYLTLSYSSSAYIHKAILQSGTALSRWALNRDPKSQALDYARRVNCVAESTEKIVSCMKRLDPATFLEQMKGTSVIFSGPNWSIDRIFVPTIETVITHDTFLAADPREILTYGNFRSIPLMFGVNSGEGLLSMWQFATSRKYREMFRSTKFWTDTFAKQYLLLSPEEAKHADEIKRYYLGSSSFDPQSFETFLRIRDIFSDLFYYLPQQDSIRLHLAANTEVYGYFYNKSNPISVFDFNRAIIPGSRLPKTLQLGRELAGTILDRVILRKPRVNYGVSHGDDVLILSPVMGYISLAYRNGGSYRFSKQFVRLVTDFVSDAKRLTFQGKRVNQLRIEDEFSYFLINDEPNSGMVQAPFRNRYIFWKNFKNRYNTYGYTDIFDDLPQVPNRKSVIRDGCCYSNYENY